MSVCFFFPQVGMEYVRQKVLIWVKTAVILSGVQEIDLLFK